MRVWVSLFLASGCAGGGTALPAASTPSESAPRPPTVGTAPLASTPTGPSSKPRAPGSLSKAPANGTAPSLEVENGFPIEQFVFIDWEARGTLSPGASRSFELTPGTHSVTCADSSDVDDNPATVTEAFAAGFAYRYVVTPH